MRRLFEQQKHSCAASSWNAAGAKRGGPNRRGESLYEVAPYWLGLAGTRWFSPQEDGGVTISCDHVDGDVQSDHLLTRKRCHQAGAARSKRASQLAPQTDMSTSAENAISSRAT